MDPALRELLADGDPDEVIEAILRLTPGTNDLPEGVREISRFAEIATIRIRRGDIERVWAHPATQSLKAPRTLQFDAPEMTPESLSKLFDDGVRPRMPLGNRGKGVVVGVIDWGFDFGHPAFRDRAGRTRIKALWNQSAKGPSPRFGYGTVYTRADINAALRAPRPYTALGYHPGTSDRGAGAHGTHVADIAAGTTRPGGGGVAPEADLVFVHLASGPLSGLANLGDSVRLLEAIDFIAETAGDQPFVINMSIGRHGGPHTGLTLVEQAFDRFLEAAPDRMLVQSAGNYYLARAHTSGRLQPGGTHVIEWQTNPGDRTPNEIEIWYSDRDTFDVRITPPGGNKSVSVKLGDARGLYAKDGSEVARLYHRAYDPNTPDHHIEVFLRPEAPPGTWKIELKGGIIEDGRWHAWIERDGGSRRNQSRLPPRSADPRHTIGSICNGFLPIAVGAATEDSPTARPAPFASSGPTRDGRQKPDLAAPGFRIQAAKSTPRWSSSPRPRTVRMSGASQAAPHVCGIAAAMLSDLPRGLGIHQLRARLFDRVRPWTRPRSADLPRLGAGLLSSRLIAGAETEPSKE